MYVLKYKEIKLLEFEVTAGDAPMGCVFAVIIPGVESKALENHIREFGYEAENGIFDLTLSECHSVIGQENESLNYLGGLISWVVELQEITIDLVGIPYPEYEIKFPHLVAQYNELHKNT
jgi:hypothetical protein